VLNNINVGTVKYRSNTNAVEEVTNIQISNIEVSKRCWSVLLYQLTPVASSFITNNLYIPKSILLELNQTRYSRKDAQSAFVQRQARLKGGAYYQLS
jgi:hypothetical protein